MSACNGCYNSIELVVKFNCNHGFCCSCFPMVFLSNSHILKDIKNFDQYMNMTCLLCSKGKSAINLEKISNMMKNTNNTEDSQEICLIHSKKSEFLCKNCAINICSDCVALNTHDETKTHEILIQNSNICVNKCSKHNFEDFKYFCFSHYEYTCSNCIIEEHKNCNFCNLDEYLHKKKVDFEEIKTDLNGKSSKLFNKFQIYFNENLETLNKQREECIFNFDKAIDHLEKLIDHLIQIKDKYEESFTNIINNYENYYEILKKSLASLDKIVNYDYEKLNLHLLDSIQKVLNELKILGLQNLNFKTNKFDSITKINLEEYENDHKKFQTDYLQFNILSRIKKNRIVISNNHPNQNYKCIQTLTGHAAYVICITDLNNGLIASGSWDKQIKIWDSKKNYECIQTLTGHDHYVYCIIQLKNGLIASGSFDKTIKIWCEESESESATYKCIFTLTQHDHYVYCITELENGLIASGSGDKTIKIWDPSKNFDCVKTFTGHNSFVRCLIQLENGFIASGSWDKTIKLWDISICEFDCCVFTLHGHEDSVLSLIQLENGLIASASGDKKIKLWDPTKSYECIQTLNEHSGGVICLTRLENGKMASGSLDNTIKLWDPDSNYKSTSTLLGHFHYISCLVELENGCIISGSFDNTIKLWE